VGTAHLCGVDETEQISKKASGLERSVNYMKVKAQLPLLQASPPSKKASADKGRGFSCNAY
jgi:hypothetical protein